MTEQQAFLIQAASDYRVFRILLDLERGKVPACHPLHYLQMSTEKLAKGVMKALERPTGKLTHVAFSDMPYFLARAEIAKQLGWKNAKAFRQFLKKSAPIFRKIEELNPSVGTQHAIASSREQPNVEYPWLARDGEGNLTWHAPADRHWPLIDELRSGLEARVIQLIEVLLERFDVIFR